jgi:hypothetical protein
VVPVVGPVRPVTHPLGEGGDFGEPFGGVLAPENVDGGQRELCPRAAEAGDVRAAGELSCRIGPDGRQDDLTDQA